MPSPVEPFADSADETREEETARLEREKVWQSVMVSPDGQTVLARILRDLGLFAPVVGERMAGRHEAAILLLRELESVNAKLARAIMARVLDDDAQA